MSDADLAGRMDFDLDDILTIEVVAETVGARRSLVARLARQGLLETIESDTDEPRIPRRSIVILRRMQRLRRDLGVNFIGAKIIIDLVGRIDSLNRQVDELRKIREG
jgi:hypothetical protein